MDSVWFDSDRWNLDGLRLKRNLDVQGIIKIIPLKKDLLQINRAFVCGDDGTCLLFDFSKKEIFRVNDDSNETSSFYTWTYNFTDVQVVGDSIFGLDADDGLIVEFTVDDDRVVKVGEWKIKDLSPTNKFVVKVDSAGRKTAYLIDNESRELLSIILNHEAPTERISINHYRGKRFGSVFFLTADSENKSILVSDTKNHRILEIDCKTGNTVLIGGTGKPGDADGGVPSKARLGEPAAIAIYRQRKHITFDKLDSASRQILEMDPQQVYPRLLLVASSYGNKIKKIIETPLRPSFYGSLYFDKKIYTLIGGIEDEAPEEEILFAEENAEYSKVAHINRLTMPQPLDINVSRQGEVLILTEDSDHYRLILLRPSVAVSEISLHKISKAIHVDIS
jgi:hypothetical protein